MHDFGGVSRLDKHQALEDRVDTRQVVGLDRKVQGVLSEDAVLELDSYLEAILYSCVIR